MVYINIPYVPENNRISKKSAIEEIQVLDISDDAKFTAYKAIYNLNPRGVSFGKNLKEALLLESALNRLGIPFRQSEESEY
jgi:hypothetical protein